MKTFSIKLSAPLVNFLITIIENYYIDAGANTQRRCKWLLKAIKKSLKEQGYTITT